MSRTRSANTLTTASAILDIAERLVQRRGFNGFSYADIAAELGISTAALHYHFSSKAELGESLVARYTARFADALDVIDAGTVPPLQQLSAYCEIYRSVLNDERMCLCGMLAAEYDTLPPSMRDAVATFFDQNSTWLARLLKTGRDARELQFDGPPDVAAQSILAALEGAMLVSRPFRSGQVLDTVIARLLAEVSTSTPKISRR